MANKKLSQAKGAKNDEFYTQWADIEKEVQAYLEFDPDVFRGKTILCPCDDPYESDFFKYFASNFHEFGLRKLIATCYSGSPVDAVPYKIEITETPGPNNDGNRLTRLEGDGDFRSEEIKTLRDEADLIVTNPPFSLFREFLAWIVEAEKKFLVIANMNAITYKEVFPRIKENEMWLGATGFNEGMYFKVPADFVYADTYKFDRQRHGEKVNRVPGVCWMTNLEHGRRHQPLPLMTMEDNLKHSKHKEIRGRKKYDLYDNYDAIEVPFTDAIPSDYDGVMGVPISFLDKYCPEQFVILGATQRGCHDEVPDTRKYDDYREVKQDGTPTGSSGSKTNENANLVGNDGKKNYFIDQNGRVVQSAYQRIFIKLSNPLAF